MFSMPPATAQRIMPDMISSAALATPCAPEPHTRFTVSAGTCTGSPPPIAAWRAGFILTNDITHHHRVDLVGREARALEHFANRRGAERGRWGVLQRAAVGADRGAHGIAEHDFGSCHVSLLQCAGAASRRAPYRAPRC